MLRRGAWTGALALAVLLVVSGAPPAGAAERGTDRVRERSMPRDALSLRVEDGKVEGERADRSLIGALRDPGRPGEAATYVRAVREMVERSWGVELPDPRADAAASESTGQLYAYGIPVGDADADGLGDVLSYEFDEGTQVFSLTMRKGTDGSALWSPALPNAYDVLVLPYEDMDGDGGSDVLMLVVDLTSPYLGGCAVAACAIHWDTGLNFELRMLSGADGSTLWSRTIEGGIRETFVLADALVGFAYADAYTVENGLYLPMPSGDHDGDGLPDLVVNSIDLDVTEAIALAYGGVAFLFGGAWSVSSATEAEVVSGASGSSVARFGGGEKAPRFSFGFPVGDAVGDAFPDLAWETVSLDPEVVACAFVLVGTCKGVGGSSAYSISMLDGADGSEAWTMQRSDFPFVFPLGADADGDGKQDLFFVSYDLFFEQGVISGAGGTVLWTLGPDDYLFYPVAGEIGGQPGSDLLSGRINYGEQMEVSIVRIDGATGAELFSTDRVLDGNVSVWAYFAGDVDADGVLDPLIDVQTYHAATETFTTHAAVESGRGGAVVFERSGDGGSLLIGGGDLDGDGHSDLVDLHYGSTPSSITIDRRALAMPGGTELWSGSESFHGEPDGFLYAFLDLWSSPDTSGLGGDDLVWNRIVLRDHCGPDGCEFDDAVYYGVLEGTNGTFAWERGTP